MNDLIAKWNSSQCPILNGLTFSNGQHYPIKPVDAPRDPLPRRLAHGPPENIAETGQLQWAFVNILSEATSSSSKLRASAGEGSMGGDGVIALFEATGALRWIAFFDFSNPFESVRFDGADLVAENNLGETWRLSLACPWDVTVDAVAPDGSQRSQ